MDRSHSGLDPAKNWFVIEMNIPRTPRPKTRVLSSYLSSRRRLMGAGKEGAPDKGFADARVHRLPPRSRRRDGSAHAPVRRAPRGGGAPPRVWGGGGGPPARGGAGGRFAVSHMGKLFVEGPGVHAALARLSANVVPTRPGRARYTFLLREDGTILDDAIVTCLSAG